MIQYNLTGQLDTIPDKKAILLSNETGFAPLTSFVSKNKLKKNQTLKRVIEMLDKQVGVAGFRFKQEHELNGFVLATGERSSVYETYATPNYGKPYRDFYYAVHYQAYVLCEEFINTDHLIITHLSGGGKLDGYDDIVKTAAEALKHYHYQHNESDLKITFGGCCIREEHFSGIHDFYGEVDGSAHQSLKTKRETFSDNTLEVTLDFIDVQ